MLTSRLASRFALLVLLTGVSCSDDNPTRDYPRVATLEVTDITSNGVSFHGSIEAEFLDKVTDHGFVWSQGDKPSIETSSFVRLGKPVSPDFTTEVTHQLLIGITYNVRAYALMNTRKVYGPKVTFLSLGSEGPKIEDFNPKTGKPKDIVIIKGKNFSEQILENKVLFETSSSTYTAVVKKASTTELEIEVPLFYIKTSFPSVSILGQKNTSSSSFQMKNVPEIAAIVPSTVRVCDTLKITGLDLLSLGNPVIFLKNNVIIPHSISASEIKIIIKQILLNPLTVTLRYPQIELSQPLGNVFAAPIVETFSPHSVSVNDLITITGTNLPRCELTVVTSTEAVLGKQSLSSSQIVLKVQKAGCLPFQFALEVNGNRFFLSDPVSTSGNYTVLGASPLTGTMGDLITVTGSGLDNAQCIIGGGIAYPQIQEADHVSFAVPGDAYADDPDGNTTLTIEGCGNNVDFPFILKRPEIIDFYPKKVTFDTEIVTVEGNNLSSFTTEIYLENGQSAYQVFDFSFPSNAPKTFSLAGVFPPGSIDIFNIRILSAGMETISSSTIEIDLAPQITEFYPLTVTDPNQTITIQGRNFQSNGGNTVTLENDTQTLGVTSYLYEDNQQITFSIEDSVGPGFSGEFFIKVEVNGLVAISQEKIFIAIP